MIKHIILCADDYAQSPTISQGIINLIEQERLSATSCLVNSPHWHEHANWLKTYAGQVDIGLHFNLTMGSSLGDMKQLATTGKLPTLGKLMREAYFIKLQEQEIFDELNRQLDRFEEALGKSPDFIDGHQHVHCLPVIRRAVIACYNKRYHGKKVWMRNICPSRIQQLFSQPAFIKKIILYLIGGRTIKNLMANANIPHNNSFAGIYNFDTIKYLELFPAFLGAIEDNGLIMCHPGLASNNIDDPIATTRSSEYAYLASDDFLADCQKFQVKLSRFRFNI